ncbi:peptidoglycan-binding domain-containing protein [Streptomyces sp. NRRL S-244]|uniref:peptidoglycan-binding domain-containing protein n=1 Tax=Streptomyces sp. NRRL S-244 TaxID=1463897 RepID=UPI00131A56AC|nr:peptidoglycan-binding domain-containing protein [Streptomyces sp. NRRL S-244]
MTLPEPRQSADPPPAQPVRGVVAGPAGGYAQGAQTPPGDDTPAYGIPVAWPDSPPQAGWPAETVRLQAATPAAGAESTNGGGGRGRGGGPEKRSGATGRRRLPTILAGAGTVVAVGTAALALGMLPRSGDSDTVLLDAKPSAPAASVAPAGPTQPTATHSPSRSASASASPSPSASKSASPSASPTASRSSAPPSATPSASTSRAPSSPPPPPKAPTLRYGDSGPEVEKMQRLLAGQGLYRGKINGRFDDRTENAVSEFQWRNNIDDDWGVYGPETRRALEGTG